MLFASFVCERVGTHLPRHHRDTRGSCGFSKIGVGRRQRQTQAHRKRQVSRIVVGKTVLLREGGQFEDFGGWPILSNLPPRSSRFLRRGWESRRPPAPETQLPQQHYFCKVELMEVPFTPDVQAKLDQMARDTGRRSDELVQDAVIGFFDELAFTRDLLERRYRDLESGRVQPIDGEEAYRRLMAKTEEHRRHSAK
jgi:predicted transcriptional regulator